MRVLVLASRNAGKVRELAAMLAPLEVEVRSIAEFTNAEDVVEDAATFAGNAMKKARAAHEATGLPALADDSGLVVDALGGEPGVYSARYGGPGLDDPGRCAHLLRRLAAAGVEASPGRFHCAMALVGAGGEEQVREADWEGIVRGPMRGDNGFGYDPIFEPAEHPQRTSAELPPAEKNRLSHRSKALAALLALLRERPELVGAPPAP